MGMKVFMHVCVIDRNQMIVWFSYFSTQRTVMIFVLLTTSVIVSITLKSVAMIMLYLMRMVVSITTTSTISKTSMVITIQSVIPVI